MDGQISSETNYKDGKEDGKSAMYYDDGMSAERYHFEGSRIEKEEYFKAERQRGETTKPNSGSWTFIGWDGEEWILDMVVYSNKLWAQAQALSDSKKYGEAIDNAQQINPRFISTDVYTEVEKFISEHESLKAEAERKRAEKERRESEAKAEKERKDKEAQSQKEELRKKKIEQLIAREKFTFDWGSSTDDTRGAFWVDVVSTLRNMAVIQFNKTSAVLDIEFQYTNRYGEPLTGNFEFRADLNEIRRYSHDAWVKNGGIPYMKKIAITSMQNGFSCSNEDGTCRGPTW